MNESNHSMRSSSIPLRDKIFLSPTEKYSIYGKFPWKMFLSICIAISTACQVLFIIGGTTSYSRAEELFFHDQFIKELESNQIEYSRKLYIYSIDSLIDHIKKSIDNYYDLQDSSLDYIYYPQAIEDIKINMEMYFITSYYNHANRPIKNNTNSFILSKNNLGPFENTEEKRSTLIQMLRKTRLFELNYTLYTYIPGEYADHFKCFYWEIKQKYSFEQRSVYKVTLDIKKNYCPEQIVIYNQNGHDFELKEMNLQSFLKNYFWIHIIVMILSSVNLILTFKYIYTRSELYAQIKKKYKVKFTEVPRISNPSEKKQKSKWELLSSKDKEKFFDMWNILGFIGNIVQILSSALSLFNKNDKMVSVREILIGIGAMFAFINMGRYLEYIKDYGTIFSTIKTAVPNILKYSFGVLPIFLGFIFFGVALFWRSERFRGIPITIISLFAVMNGDSIYDVINDLKGVNFFIGQVYSYSFAMLFISIVMNIMVSIIEDAYVASKITNQNHWIYDFINLDSNAKGSQKSQDDSTGKEEDKGKDMKLVDLMKEKRKVNQNVRSQNILLEAIKTEAVIDDQEKGEEWQLVPKTQDKTIPEKPKVSNTTKIDEAMFELETITNDILNFNQTTMTNELKDFLKDHLGSLLIKIKDLETDNN